MVFVIWRLSGRTHLRQMALGRWSTTKANLMLTLTLWQERRYVCLCRKKKIWQISLFHFDTGAFKKWCRRFDVLLRQYAEEPIVTVLIVSLTFTIWLTYCTYSTSWCDNNSDSSSLELVINRNNRHSWESALFSKLCNIAFLYFLFISYNFCLYSVQHWRHTKNKDNET